MIALIVTQALAMAGPADDVMLRVRVDPLVAIVAQGTSVSVDVAPANVAWRATVTGFVVDIPRLMVPLVVDGGPELKISERCLQGGIMWAADPRHRGLFVGPELFAYQLITVDEDHPARHATTYELYLHVTVGGVVFPFEDTGGFVGSLFVMPLVTAGLPVFGTGDAVFADGTVIDDRLFNWHATVSLGLELW